MRARMREKVEEGLEGGGGCVGVGVGLGWGADVEDGRMVRGRGLREGGLGLGSCRQVASLVVRESIFCRRGSGESCSVDQGGNVESRVVRSKCGSIAEVEVAGRDLKFLTSQQPSG